MTCEAGMVLPATLVFMAVLALLGTTAFVMSSTEMKIGRNHVLSAQVYYHACAGCEEARGRLADGAPHPIPDTAPGQGAWRVYLGQPQDAARIGFDSSNPFNSRYDSLADLFGYVVEVRHQVDTSGHLLYWGDRNGDGLFERNPATGKHIYLVTALASRNGVRRTVQTEIAEMPRITVPGAVYVESATTITGTSTWIIGLDGCSSLDIAGIATPQGPGSVTVSGGAHVVGSGAASPNVAYNGTDMDVVGVVRFIAEYADHSYLALSISHTGTTVPGPGDGWGHPVLGSTLQDPASCSSRTIVHYDTAGTYVKFSGGVWGCGVLLVEGDLEIEGDFFWYGALIVTGSVVFTGGGDRNITGTLVSGGAVICDVSAGDSNIVYCSTAVNGQTESRPLDLLSWRSGL